MNHFELSADGLLQLMQSRLRRTGCDMSSAATFANK